MKTKSRAVAQEEILFESTNRFYLFSPSRIRFLATGAEASKPASRGFHANGVKRMGGHGHDEPYYLHAKHMYNLHRMKHQKRNVTLSVLGAVGIGVGVPAYAVIFQQQKTASA